MDVQTPLSALQGNLSSDRQMSSRQGNLSSDRQMTNRQQQQANSGNNNKKKAAVVQTIVIVVLVATAVVTLLLVIAAVFLAARKTRLHQSRLKSSFPHQPILWTDKDKQNCEKKCRADNRLSEGNIFVAISSYRDPELCLTLEDLFEKAHCKHRLWIGIVEQNDAADEASCHIDNFSSKHKSHCRIIKMDWRDAQGPCVARAKCESLWRNEPYFLLVDSHMRFEPGWDVDLLQMLFKCRRPKRTVITMYPQGYDRYKNPATGKVHTKVDIRKGFRYEQLRGFNNDGILEFESYSGQLLNELPKKVPKSVPMFAACFAFGSSDVLKLVPYDPNLVYLFFGEEASMACRLYTHGFDLVGPTHSVLYHNWARTYRKTYFNTIVEAERVKSVARVKRIMSGELSGDKYGTGRARSVEDWWKYEGVDPKTQQFIRPHRPWRAPPDERLIQDEFVSSSSSSSSSSNNNNKK